jgi:hypothetical protein
MWRIRLELHPEHSRGGYWYGGCILWGYDQRRMTNAERIARRWRLYGQVPLERGSEE